MRYRFSIKMIFVLVAVFAAGLAFVPRSIRFARQNERTIAKLRGLKAIATLDDGTMPTHANSKSDWALTLRKITSVTNVASDEALAQVSKLEHLRRVEINGPVTDQGLATLGGAITDLKIVSESITDFGLRQLSRLTNLETLQLSGPQLSDGCLQYVKDLKKLTILRLGGSGITDAGMKDVAKLRSLQTLDLTDTAVSNDGIKELGGLTDLINVEVGGTKATMGGLAHLFIDLQGRGIGTWFPAEIVRKGNDVSIAMSGEQFQDDIIPYLLKAVPEITGVELSSTGITDEGLAELSVMKKLRRLTLRNGRIRSVRGLASLERLSLFGLGDRLLPRMRKLPKLNSLDFADYHHQHDTEYLGNGLAQLSKFADEIPCLHTLILANAAIDDSHIAQLANFQQLKNLNLDRTKITDVGLQLLSSMPNLASLQIQETAITNEGLRELSRLKTLQILGLSGNRQISDVGIANLTDLTLLRELRLLQTSVTRSGCDDLQRSLPRCKVLHP